MKTKLLKHLFLFLAVAMLGACASAPQQATDPVVDRAEGRWEALLGNDLEGAYAYFTPGTRSTMSVIDFGVAHRLRKVRWTGAEYLDHTCEKSRCSVRFEVNYEVRNAVPGVSVFKHHATHEETWIKTEGQWWYLPEN